MKRFAFVFAALLVAAVPAFAQHEHSGHGSMKGHGAKQEGGAKEVFKSEKQGVKVIATLNDVESAMKAMAPGITIDKSKMDPNLTHHIAATITPNQMTGPVKKATLKLTLNKATKEYALMAMHGHFGADVAMKEKGTYKAVLTVETQSGKTEFKFDLKN